MSFISSLFGSGKLQADGDAADAKLAEMNQRDYAPGGRLYNKIATQQGTAAADAAYQQTLNNLESGATGNVSSQIDAAFDEGLQDGANNITGFVSGAFKFLGKALGSILLGIPVWVWLAVGAAAFFYLGGGVWIRRKISKA